MRALTADLQCEVSFLLPWIVVFQTFPSFSHLFVSYVLYFSGFRELGTFVLMAHFFCWNAWGLWGWFYICSNIARFTYIFLYIYCFFTVYARYLKRVISKRWMCISEAGTIHRWFSGAYLMRSSGHILLSLLHILDWLNRSLISWLLFCAVRLLWFFTHDLMTSVTYGMRKSLCKVTFDMYQGALASFLNVLIWNVWRIFVWNI
jgi:hypothetical protein